MIRHLGALLTLIGILSARTASAAPTVEAYLLDRTPRPSFSVAVTKALSPSQNAKRRAAIRRLRAETLSAQRVREAADVMSREKNMLFALVNEERKSRGIAPLIRTALLDQAAQAHANDMEQRKYFSHETPEGTLYDVRIQKTGYPGFTMETCHCGYRVQYAENLATGQKNPQQVVKAWMDSGPHRQNILDPQLEHVGYGIIGKIWVQNFGAFQIVEWAEDR